MYFQNSRLEQSKEILKQVLKKVKKNVQKNKTLYKNTNIIKEPIRKFKNKQK